MVNFKEFIEKMESVYHCEENFRQQMRNTVSGIFEMDSDNATKLVLLKRIEETYSRHSKNYSYINEVSKMIERNNSEISLNLGFERPTEDLEYYEQIKEINEMDW